MADFCPESSARAQWAIEREGAKEGFSVAGARGTRLPHQEQWWREQLRRGGDDFLISGGDVDAQIYLLAAKHRIVSKLRLCTMFNASRSAWCEDAGVPLRLLDDNKRLTAHFFSLHRLLAKGHSQ